MTKKKVCFNDFSEILLDGGKYENMKFSTNKMFNIKIENGMIKKSSGIMEATTPATADPNSLEYEFDYSKAETGELKNLYFVTLYDNKYDQFMPSALLYGASERISYINVLFTDFEFTPFTKFNFTSTPEFVFCRVNNSRDAILIVSNDRDVVALHQTGYMEELTNIPKLSSICVHNGRWFCTVLNNGRQIWYSNYDDISKIGTEEAGTGTITINDGYGRCNKIISFNGNVYLFRDYAITKIVDNNSSFDVTNIYTECGYILKDTISVCGDEIYFMTLEGLHSFNGISVNKVKTPVDNLFNCLRDTAGASSLNGKYYLSFRIKDDEIGIYGESEDFVNNALLIYGVEDKTVELLRGPDIKRISVAKTKGYERAYYLFNGTYNGHIGQCGNNLTYFNDELKSVYETNYMFSGNISEKVLRSVSINSSKDIDVEIITDSSSLTFKTKKDGINNFRCATPFSNFKIRLSSNGKFDVKQINFEWLE